MAEQGWIGVDLDGTLAHYTGYGDGTIGQPIPLMLARVRDWLVEGKKVKIFTARARSHEDIIRIRVWCLNHLGEILEVTSTKDFLMIELWDDRCVQVIPNTGLRVDGKN